MDTAQFPVEKHTFPMLEWFDSSISFLALTAFYLLALIMMYVYGRREIYRKNNYNSTVRSSRNRPKSSYYKEFEKLRNLTPSYWNYNSAAGERFESRSGHDVVSFGKNAYVFGGCSGPSQNGVLLSDVKVFDLEKNIWKTLKTHGKGPSGRASFGMCKGPTDNTIIVAGGTGDDTLFGDIFELNVSSNHWKQLYWDCDESRCRFYGQSVCSYRDKLIFFGGSTGFFYTNSTCEYDMEHSTWKEWETCGEKPSPRYQHTATVVRDTMFIIGGGSYRPTVPFLEIFALNLKTHTWTLVKTQGPSPISRVSHTTEYDPSTGYFFVGGGFDSNLERLSDFYVFDLNHRRWSCITCAGIKRLPYDLPTARAFHASCLYNGVLSLFGGADGETRFNDLWQYRYRVSPPSLSTLAGLSIVYQVHQKAKFEKRSANLLSQLSGKGYKKLIPTELLCTLLELQAELGYMIFKSSRVPQKSVCCGIRF